MYFTYKHFQSERLLSPSALFGDETKREISGGKVGGWVLNITHPPTFPSGYCQLLSTLPRLLVACQPHSIKSISYLKQGLLNLLFNIISINLLSLVLVTISVNIALTFNSYERLNFHKFDDREISLKSKFCTEHTDGSSLSG